MGFALSYVEFDEWSVEYCLKEWEHVKNRHVIGDIKGIALGRTSCNNIVKDEGTQSIWFNVVVNKLFVSDHLMPVSSVNKEHKEDAWPQTSRVECKLETNGNHIEKIHCVKMKWINYKDEITGNWETVNE